MLNKLFNSFKKIMIVEDDAVLRESVVGVLTDEGYKIVVAENGKDALPLAKRERPTLILLDLMLPDMDGMTILRELRGDSEWGKKVKVIILSNLMSNSGLGEEAKRYNVSRYIEKNQVSLENVLKVMQEVFKE